MSLCLTPTLHKCLTCSAMVSGQLWTFSRRFPGVFTLVAAESRKSGIVTTRCVCLSQEPAEQVLVLGVNPPLVSHLFCHCLRSVVDFPRRSSIALRFWRWNHGMTALGLAGAYT